MCSASPPAAKESSPEFRCRPVNMSRAARRGIRQAAQLAEEIDAYSFRTHPDGSVTWVRWRAKPPAKAPPQKGGGEPSRTNNDGGLSIRAQKRNERARRHRELHERAVRFRCTAALRHWHQDWCSAHSASAAPQSTTRTPGDGLLGPAARPQGAGGVSPSTTPRETTAMAPMPTCWEEIILYHHTGTLATRRCRPMRGAAGQGSVAPAQARAPCVCPQTHTALVGAPPTSRHRLSAHWA